MAGERPNERTPDGRPAKPLPFMGEVSATLSAGDFVSPPPPRAPDRTDDADDENEDDDPAGAKDLPSAAGKVVGRYVILSLLGAGGMGAVYAAYDPELDRKVALKLLRPDAVSLDSARMLREARALAKLAHPNVVAVHDVGTVDASLFIAMEYVDGFTVNRWLRQRGRSHREVLDVFMAAGRGLAAAHRANLVHRDFKPDNMMVANDGRVRVLDFGLARTELSVAAETTLEESLVSDANMSARQRLTRDGALLGTPSYMAPEQWRGAVAEARSDQFSYCVALWEALYGERPFRGTTLHALMTSVTRGKIDQESGARKVPLALRRALERGLARDPEGRFPTMDALLTALERGQLQQRRRVLLVGLALTGLGAGAVQLHENREMAACTAAGAQISEVWNPAAQESLRASLMATGVEHAATSHAKAAALIDEWAAQWSTMRTQVCVEAEVEDTRSRELYTASLACLDEQRDALAVLLEVFEHSTPTDVQRLVPAVAGLTQLEQCSEPHHLERRAALPGQADTRAQALELRRELRRAQGLAAAGRYHEGLVLAESSLLGAEALGHAALTIEARLLIGDIADPRRGVTALERVYVDAGELGDDEIAAAAAVKLVTRIGVDNNRPAEGLQWALPAQVLIKKLGQERGLLAAGLANSKAMVLRARGEHDEALALYNDALQIREEVLGATHPAVATILNNLGNLQRDRGDQEAALAAHHRALQIREQALGADHPDVSATLNNLGLLEQVRGNYAEAQAYLERALKIVESSFGHGSVETATIVNNLGRLHQLRGNFPEAQALLERALQLREAELGPRHLDVAITLQNLGMLHMARGERLAAREALERVLQIRERQMDDSHPELVRILDLLGTLNYRIGDQEQALALHSRALEHQRARLGPDHIDVAHTLRNLAQVHHARGDRDRALTLASDALRFAEHALGPDHPDIAAFLNTLGLLQRGRDAVAARTMLERAREISLRTRGPKHPATAMSLQRLGDLDLDAKEYARAETRLREALQIREAVGPDAPEVADVLVSLGQLALAQAKPDDAVPLLERAVKLRGRGGVPAPQLAQARFELARALRDANNDDRPRSRALADEALLVLRASGPAYTSDVAAIEAWLR